MAYDIDKYAAELVQLMRLTRSSDVQHRPEWSDITMVKTYLEHAYTTGFADAIDAATAQINKSFDEMETAS